jgi:6-phosphofructokinase
MIANRVQEVELDVAVIGIPKTIDNDIGIVDRSFGFETAGAHSIAAHHSPSQPITAHHNPLQFITAHSITFHSSQSVTFHSIITRHIPLQRYWRCRLVV